jgi:hypothetical protein
VVAKRPRGGSDRATMGPVRPALERFLTASDLAELRAARVAISSIDGDEARALHAIVAAWRDEQAVANLLMYPELLPEDDRTPALAEGLSGVHGDYPVLAAAVGLAAWVAGDEDAPAIAERLLALVDDPTTPLAIAVRAAVALGAYSEHVAPTDLVGALGHRHEAVRHNVLAAALTGWGAVETLDAVDAAAAAGLLADDVADQARRVLVDAGLSELDEPLDDGHLVEPLLVPIPDLVAWEQTAATAS